MTSPMGLSLDKVNYYVDCTNVGILETQALSLVEVSHTDKTTSIILPLLNSIFLSHSKTEISASESPFILGRTFFPKSEVMASIVF